MAELVDQYGNPIKRNALLQEDLPTVRSVRPQMSGVSAGIDPGKLARILKGAEIGDPDAQMALAEELEEKDAHYLSVIGTRKRAVAQLEITVEAASDSPEHVRHAEFIEGWLDRDLLEAEMFDMLDAIGKGYSCMEIMWDTSEKQWQPYELVWRDPRYFMFERWPSMKRELMIKSDGGQPLPLTPYKYIPHIHQAKSGSPARGGVIRPCAWMWLFKNFSLKDWVIFVETYGQPLRVGKYGTGASEEDRDVLLKAVASIGSDAAAIIPESMQLEFIESGDKRANAEIYERLCKYADQQMSKAILGQTTTVDAISGGHAVSKEHNEVREDIERADAKMASQTLNMHLIRPMVDLNFGAQKAYPRLRIGRSESVDIKALTDAADKAVRMGMRISERGLRDKLGLPEPEDDEDTLKLPSNAPSLPALPDDPEADENTAAAQTGRAAPGGHTCAAHQDGDGDVIDDLADELAGDYEEVLDPMITAIETALDACTDLAEFPDKLLAAAQDLGIDDLAERVAQSSFAANIAGQVRAKLED